MLHVQPACPCCGQDLPIEFNPQLTFLKEMPLPFMLRGILNALLVSYPRGLYAEQIIREVYTNFNEPESSHMVIRVQMAHLRRRMEPYGWTVSKRMPGRGNHSQYRLYRVGTE